MGLEAVRELSAVDLAEVLDELGISPGWVTGDECRAAALTAPDEVVLPEPPAKRISAFQNMIVGTIAEHTFNDIHLVPLELDGFKVVDYVGAGENRDFGVQRDGLELPINVKVASTLFRKAKTVVGLEPDDCIPISAYKAIGASEKVPNLIYVDLVDFTLRERVDAFMESLGGSLGIGWHLFSWFGGKGSKKAQDEYARTLFGEYADRLKALIPIGTSFHAISALRVLAILREEPRRVPGLGVRGAGTGGFNAEVNVHISVSREMRPWEEISAMVRSDGIQPLLDEIGATAALTLPDPSL